TFLKSECDCDQPAVEDEVQRREQSQLKNESWSERGISSEEGLNPCHVCRGPNGEWRRGHVEENLLPAEAAPPKQVDGDEYGVQENEDGAARTAKQQRAGDDERFRNGNADVDGRESDRQETATDRQRDKREPLIAVLRSLRQHLDDADGN